MNQSDSRDSAGHSTDLRTRIAALQLAHMPDDYERDMGECRCGFKFSTGRELAKHVADAVIRELKLEVEDGECGYCQAQLPGCRYSTWVDDE